MSFRPVSFGLANAYDDDADDDDNDAAVAATAADDDDDESVELKLDFLFCFCFFLFLKNFDAKGDHNYKQHNAYRSSLICLELPMPANTNIFTHFFMICSDCFFD